MIYPSKAYIKENVVYEKYHDPGITDEGYLFSAKIGTKGMPFGFLNDDSFFIAGKPVHGGDLAENEPGEWVKFGEKIYWSTYRGSVFTGIKDRVTELLNGEEVGGYVVEKSFCSSDFSPAQLALGKDLFVFQSSGMQGFYEIKSPQYLGYETEQEIVFYNSRFLEAALQSMTHSWGRMTAHQKLSVVHMIDTKKSDFGK